MSYRTKNIIVIFAFMVQILLISIAKADNPIIEFEENWRICLEQIKNSDKNSSIDCVNELVQQRDRAGLVTLKEYSLEILAEAERVFILNDQQKALFLMELAHKLSPLSPVVLLRSMKLVHAIGGTKAILSNSYLVIKNLTADYLVMLNIIKGVIYPVLWSATFALYLAFCLIFVTKMPEFIRTIANMLPATTRGILAPAISLLILIFPCFFKFVICLFLWSLILLFILPKQKWMAVLTAVIILAWGIAIPIRENMDYWLKHNGFTTFLDFAGGNVGSDYEQKLLRYAEEKGNDGVAWYVLADYYLKLGYLEKTETTIIKAEENLGTQAWTTAVRGSLEFVKGNSKQADQLLTQALDDGLQSAGLYYNISKVKFDLVDLESNRNFLSSAKKIDSKAVDHWQRIEELEGLKSIHSLGEIQLPSSLLLKTALNKSVVASAKASDLSRSLVYFNDCWVLIVVAIVILIATHVIQSRGLRKFSSYYSDYQTSFITQAFMFLVPGGLWIRNNKPGVTCLCIFGSTFLLLPLVGWPLDLVSVFDKLPGLFSIYACVVGLVLFFVYYVSYYSNRSLSCKQE